MTITKNGCACADDKSTYAMLINAHVGQADNKCYDLTYKTKQAMRRTVKIAVETRQGTSLK